MCILLYQVNVPVVVVAHPDNVTPTFSWIPEAYLELVLLNSSPEIYPYPVPYPRPLSPNPYP